VRKKKKNKGKKKGSKDATSPPSAPRPAPRGKREPVVPQPPKSMAGNGQGPQKAPERKRKEAATTDGPASQPPIKGNEEAWRTVVGRKARRGEAAESQAMSAPTPAARPGGVGKGASQSRPPARALPPSPVQGNGGGKTKRRRAPRTAAVVITCSPGQYKECCAARVTGCGVQSGDMDYLRPPRFRSRSVGCFSN